MAMRIEQKQGKGNMSFLQNRSSNYAPSSASAPVQNNMYDQKAQNHQNSRAQGSQSQASVTQGSKGKPPCATCGRLHMGECRDGKSGCFEYGQLCHYQINSPTWGNKASLWLQHHRLEVIRRLLLLVQAEDQTACMLWLIDRI